MINKWNLENLSYESATEPPYMDYMPSEPPYDEHFNIA